MYIRVTNSRSSVGQLDLSDRFLETNDRLKCGKMTRSSTYPKNVWNNTTRVNTNSSIEIETEIGIKR